MTQIKFAQYLSIVDYNLYFYSYIHSQRIYIVNERVEADQPVSKGHFKGQRAWRGDKKDSTYPRLQANDALVLACNLI